MFILYGYGLAADRRFGRALQGATDFGAVIRQMLEDAGFDVWDPPSSRCGPHPEQGCNAGARRGDVSLRAIVLDIATGFYTVTVRASEYVGP